MLSLKACLEEMARLGPRYVVNECGYKWEARELLHWLGTTFPHELERRVHFLRPDRYGDGAIYAEGSPGELAYAVPLYQVEQQRVAAKTRRGLEGLGCGAQSATGSWSAQEC